MNNAINLISYDHKKIKELGSVILTTLEHQYKNNLNKDNATSGVVTSELTPEIIEIKKYYKNGFLHNEDGPALVAYNTRLNMIKRISWFEYDKPYNNKGGPAHIIFHDSGELQYFIFKNNNILHNLYGPAESQYFEGGDVLYEDWWIDGNKVRAEDHPFNVFRKKYNLPKDMLTWPFEFKMEYNLKNV